MDDSDKRPGDAVAAALPAPTLPPATAGQAAPPVIASTELLGNAQEVWIHHNGEVYRLQETRAGKLILTK